MELFNRRTVLFLHSCHMGVVGAAARRRMRSRVRGSSETNQNRVALVSGSLRAMTVLEILGGSGRGGGGGGTGSFQELLSVSECFMVVPTVVDCILALGVGVCSGDWLWRRRGDRGWEVVWIGVDFGDDGVGGSFFGAGGKGQ
ncbi:hypothetical protein F5H01DRAFT_330222 [Linnemannia elongata]|nr:hypothetical protein F5H01DRAFT_330222 [Linnemannia elongata]